MKKDILKLIENELSRLKRIKESWERISLSPRDPKFAEKMLKATNNNIAKFEKYKIRMEKIFNT